jgi:hypothetical protein
MSEVGFFGDLVKGHHQCTAGLERVEQIALPVVEFHGFAFDDKFAYLLYRKSQI